MGIDWRHRQEDMRPFGKQPLHPVWRGVGFLLILILGVAAYFFSGWIIRMNAVEKWIYIPPPLISVPRLTFLPDGALLQLVVAILFMIFAFGILSVVYAFFFPPQLGETDSPPLYRRRRKRR
jgi:hypothetical protein